MLLFGLAGELNYLDYNTSIICGFIPFVYYFKMIYDEYLINNKEHICIICNKKLPLCLLETAHIKPRCLLNYNEICDNNIVEFMCRYCHTLYDNGLLGINNGQLCVSTTLHNYNLDCISNKHISSYNLLKWDEIIETDAIETLIYFLPN